MSDTPTPSQAAEKAIREALEAGPTPGPWIIATSNSWRRIVTQHRMESVCEPITQNDGHPDLYFRNGGADGPDARLIAACNPEAMTALLDAFTAKDAQLAEMRAEVERLKADSLRMDWLEKHDVNVRVPAPHGSLNKFWAGPWDDDGMAVPSDLRKRIDAALAADGKDGAR